MWILLLLVVPLLRADDSVPVCGNSKASLNGSLVMCPRGETRITIKSGRCSCGDGSKCIPCTENEPDPDTSIGGKQCGKVKITWQNVLYTCKSTAQISIIADQCMCDGRGSVLSPCIRCTDVPETNDSSPSLPSSPQGSFQGSLQGELFPMMMVSSSLRLQCGMALVLNAILFLLQ
jgi:hypothetical protein